MPRNALPVPAALRPPTVPEVPRLALRPDEAARSLGICERTLRDLDDGPPTVRLGRVVLYPVAGIADWLAKRAARDASPQEFELTNVADARASTLNSQRQEDAA